MNVRDIFNTAFRNLTRRRLRTFLTSFAVFIGILLLTLLTSLGLGVRQWLLGQITSQIEYTRVTVTQKGTFSGGGMSMGTGSLTNDDEESKIKIITPKVLEEFGDIEHVTQVQPISFVMPQSLQIKGEKDKLKGVIGSGMNLESGDAYGRKILAGSLENWYESEDNIVLTHHVADSYNKKAEDLVGQTIVLEFSKRASSGPMFMSQQVVETVSYEFIVKAVIDVGLDNAVFVIPDQASTRISTITAGAESTDAYLKDVGYSIVYVNTDDLENTKSVSAKITDMGFDALTVDDLIGMIDRIFLVVQGVLAVFGLIALFVASLGIINTMIMAIYERTNEIGVMKAVGATRSDVKRLFMAESGIIGLLGGTFGVLASFGANKGLNALINYFLQKQGQGYQNLSTFPWWLMVAGILFAFVLGILAGLYPASRAARLDPIEALRHE